MTSGSQLTPCTNSLCEVHDTSAEEVSLHPSHGNVIHSSENEKQASELLATGHDFNNDNPSLSNWSIDPQNPTNWSSPRKWTTIILLVVTNFIASTCTSAFEPALPSIMADFHSTNGSIASLTISIYTIGYCLGPLLIAPISELYGHVTVLYPGYIGFMLALAVCGSSKSLPLFVVFRAIMGLAAITFVLMGPAIVADLIPREQRGLALSIMSTGPVVVCKLGPIIGGYIVESISWRWIFYSTLIAFGVLFSLSLIILKETYAPVVLSRKQNNDRKDLPTSQKITNPGNPRETLQAAWNRPFKMLFLSPIVPFVGFYSALSNAYGMVCFATLGTVFQDNYSFAPGESGLAYLGLMFGFLFSQLTFARFSDRYMLKMEAKNNNKRPEYRLPPMFIGAFLLPIGFFWYGWSLEYHTHWVVPILGSMVIAVGILFSYLPVQMYLVDTYTIYAASATGACTIIRSICSTLIPLSANPLYDHLGYGWGNSVLAFIAIGFVPIALLVLRYGERIRTNPRFQPKL
ncbi:major facilitator superfamily transporter [Botrytis cinerea]